MNWCIQNVVVVIICTPAAFRRSILHYIPYKQKNRNRKEIGFNVQYEHFLAFINSPVLRPGGGGDSYMEQTGMLVGNFEFNP